MAESECNFKGYLIEFKKLKIIKTIAIIVICIFFQQQISWAEGGSKATWSNAISNSVSDTLIETDYQIPYKYAKINEVNRVGSETQIIHIQDAHASLSAQYSIVELLDDLLSKYDMDFVAIEGGAGYVDASFLKSFPINSMRKEKAEDLMKKGLMGAGEFFSIIQNDKDIALYGVEDEPLYWQNIEEFRAVSENQNLIIPQVDAFISQLRALEDKVCSSELIELNTNAFHHRESKISFSQYWEIISSYINKYLISTMKYGEINKLRQAIILERNIDFTAANIERKNLIADLNERLNKIELEGLVLNAVAFREDKISKSDFHEYLIALAEEYSVPSDEYQNLIRFTEYITIYESLNIVSLHFELEVLEDEIREKIYRNTDESELYEKIVLGYLLKKLYMFELSDRDYEILMAYRSKINASEFTAYIKKNCNKYKVNIPEEFDVVKMVSGIDKALLFYSTAKKRDAAMLSNTIKKMQKEGKKVAALITGGFHSKGLSKLMKDRSLSYLIVSPKYETNEERPYFAILTGKKNYYADLVEADRYNIAIFDFSNNQTPESMQNDAAQLMAKARIVQGEDPAKISKLWKNKYRVLQRERQNNPARMGVPIMTSDQFDTMIDSLEVVIVSGHAVVLLNGEFFAAFRKNDTGVDVNKVKPTQKILSNIKNIDSQTQDITNTEMGLDSDLQDISSIISQYKDSEYLSSIVERLPERANRRGVKTSYVIKILKRDGLLPTNWSNNALLVKEVRALSTRVKIEGTAKEAVKVQPEFVSSFKKEKIVKTTIAESKISIQVKKQSVQSVSEEFEEAVENEIDSGWKTILSKKNIAKFSIFHTTGSIYRFASAAFNISLNLWRGVRRLTFQVKWKNFRTKDGRVFFTKKTLALFQVRMLLSGIMLSFFAFTEKNMSSILSVRSVFAGTLDMYVEKIVASDAPWKLQTHESALAARDSRYDPANNGVLVTIDMDSSKAGRNQTEVFLEPLHSEVPGLSRSNMDLYKRTVVVELLVPKGLKGAMIQLSAMNSDNWEAENSSPIEITNTGRIFVSYTFDKLLTKNTRLFILRILGKNFKGDIVLGRVGIGSIDGKMPKLSPVLPKSLVETVEEESVPVSGLQEKGVDLELKKDGYYWHGRKLTLPGINWRVLGHFGFAFGYGNVKSWFPSPVGVHTRVEKINREFSEIKKSGIKKVRVWLADDGRSIFDKNGHVTGYDEVFKKDVKVFLDLAEENGIAVEFTLIDYLIAGKGRWVKGVWVQGRHYIFTNPDIRSEFVDRFLIPLLRDFGDHPAFRIVDLGNEFEWLVHPSEGGGWDKIDDPKVKDTPVPIKAIVAYLKETSDAVKKYAPDMIITGGFNAVSHPGLYHHLEGVVTLIAGHYYPKFGDKRELLSHAKNVADSLGLPIALEEYPSRTDDFSEMLALSHELGYIGADPWNYTASSDDQTSSASRLYQQLKALQEFISSKSTLYSVAPIFLLFSSTFRAAFSQVTAPIGSFSLGLGNRLEVLKENFMGTELFEGAEYFVSFVQYSTTAKISVALFLGTVMYFLWLISKVNKLEKIDAEANRDFMKDLIKVIFLGISLLVSMLISTISHDNFVSAREKIADQKLEKIEKGFDDNLGMVPAQKRSVFEDLRQKGVLVSISKIMVLAGIFVAVGSAVGWTKPLMGTVASIGKVGVVSNPLNIILVGGVVLITFFSTKHYRTIKSFKDSSLETKGKILELSLHIKEVIKKRKGVGDASRTVRWQKFPGLWMMDYLNYSIKRNVPIEQILPVDEASVLKEGLLASYEKTKLDVKARFWFEKIREMEDATGKKVFNRMDEKGFRKSFLLSVDNYMHSILNKIEVKESEIGDIPLYMIDQVKSDYFDLKKQSVKSFLSGVTAAFLVSGFFVMVLKGVLGLDIFAAQMLTMIFTFLAGVSYVSRNETILENITEKLTKSELRKTVSAKDKGFIAKRNMFLNINLLIFILFLPVFAFAGIGDPAEKAIVPIADSIFNLASLAQAAFLISVMVTAFFVYTAWQNHYKLKHARIKAKLTIVGKEVAPVKDDAMVSAERWRTGSMIGAVAMMIVTFALGDAAPEKDAIDIIFGTNWFWHSGLPQTFLLIALIGSLLWIKERFHNLRQQKATKHIKEVIPAGETRLAVAKKKVRPEKIHTVLGLPLSVYNYLGTDIIAVMTKEIGIDSIVPVDETQKNYLNEFKRKQGKMIGVFLDTSVLNEYIIYEEAKVSEKVKSIKKDKQNKLDILAIDIDSLKKDMFLMVSKAMKDIIRVMDPEKTLLSFEDIKKQLKKIESSNEIMQMVAFYTRLLPDIESVDLLEKSAYDFHFDRVNNKVFTNVSLSGKATKLLADNYENGKMKYMSVSAGSAADLRFLASGIKKMGLTKKAAQKFIHVRITDPNINENNLGQILVETGLSSYVSIYKKDGNITSPNITLTKDSMTLNEILDLVKGAFGTWIDNKSIAIGSSQNIIITDDDEKIIRSKDAPVFVEMQGAGLSSQMLWTLVEIMSHRDNLDNIPAELGSVKLLDGYGNWYIYLPNIKEIDLEALRKEIENYEKILTAA